MSNSWADKIIKIKGRALTSSERFVLYRLADHANDDGTGSYPSETTLVNETGLDRRTIRYILVALVDMALIKKAQRVTLNGHLVWEYHMVYDWALVEEVKRPDYEEGGKKKKRPVSKRKKSVTNVTQPIEDTKTEHKVTKNVMPTPPPEWVLQKQKFEKMLADGNARQNFTLIRQGEEGLAKINSLMEVR